MFGVNSIKAEITNKAVIIVAENLGLFNETFILFSPFFLIFFVVEFGSILGDIEKERAKAKLK